MHTLLLVDSDVDLIQSLVKSLTDLGGKPPVPRFRVLTAHSGVDAISILNEESVSVVVADYQMNAPTGLELVVFVSALRPRPPVIMVSAYVDKDIAIRCLNTGVFGILEKPFEHPHLFSKIDEALVRFSPSSAARDAEIELAPDSLEVGLFNRRIRLTATEFEIFSTLYANQGQWVSRNHLEHVVYRGRLVSRNLLDTHVSNLRKKIPELKNQIQALRGRGYVFRPSAPSPEHE